MPDFTFRKCPRCGNDMVRGSQTENFSQNEKVWDLAHTGTGTTVTSTTSGANYSGVAAPSAPPDAPIRRVICLVPYECPECHYKESYRE